MNEKERQEEIIRAIQILNEALTGYASKSKNSLIKEVVDILNEIKT